MIQNTTSKKKNRKKIRRRVNPVIPSGAECIFSFGDLYFAAFQKPISEDEKKKLNVFPQEVKNKIVKQWAERAHWLVEDRIGTDGITYTAFAKPH